MSRFMCLIYLTLVASFANSQTTVEAETGLFQDSLLLEFLNWNPVLPGERAFPSAGHSGQMVRVYFNDIAKPTFNGAEGAKFAPGSLIAKAVVANNATPASAASRVYFMRKMNAGYDRANGDWAYAFAEALNGKYKFNAKQGKVALCISCHTAEKRYDYVRTVEYFRRGNGP